MLNKIYTWRALFGLPVKDDFELPNEEEFTLAIELIEEELSELRDAYKNNDKKEFLDASADLEFVLKQLHAVSGTPITDAVDRVFASNMSKACKTEEEADRSAAQYNSKGIKTYIKEYQGLWFVYRDDGKLLKSINFKEPYLNDLCVMREKQTSE